jgi:hypothetical protein
MKAYVIKNLETDKYLTYNFREVVKIWEATKFTTVKEANEHLEVLAGYFQIIPIIQKNKNYEFE